MLVRFGRVSWYEAAYPDPSLGALAVRDRSPMSSLAHVDDADLRSRMDALSWNRSCACLPAPTSGRFTRSPPPGCAGSWSPTAPPVRGEKWDERDPSANVPSPTALAATWDKAGSWWLPQA